MAIIRFFSQVLLLAGCLFGMASLLLNRIIAICPKCYWNAPVYFFIELLKQPFIKIYNTNELLFFYIAGNIAIIIVIMSIVIAFSTADYFYSTLLYIFKILKLKKENEQQK